MLLTLSPENEWRSPQGMHTLSFADEQYAPTFVMLLVTFGGSSQAVCGYSGCNDYTAEECVEWTTCEMYMEESCGLSTPYPRCEDAGYYACASMSGCESGGGDFALVCLFEEN